METKELLCIFFPALSRCSWQMYISYIHSHIYTHTYVCVYIYICVIYMYVYTWVQSLGWEDPLEEGMATHSRIPWTEEPGRLQSIESQRVRHDWSDLAWMHLYVSVCVSVWYVYTCIHTHTCTHVVKPFISTIRLTYPSPHIVNFRHTWNFNSSHGAIY